MEQTVGNAGFQIPIVLEYVATIAWATSGAVVAIRKRFDVVGVFAIALVSSMGGGLLRDALFLQRTPTLLTNPVYLPLIAGTTVLVILLTKILLTIVVGEPLKKLVEFIDAIGMPAFAVVGMQLASERNIPIAGVLFIGVLNGVGGGLMRDVIVRDVPALLRPGQFSSLFLLLACVLYLLLARELGLRPDVSAWMTVAVFFCLRILAIRFNWETRSIIGTTDSDQPHDSPGRENLPAPRINNRPDA